VDGLTKAWYGYEIAGRLKDALGSAFQDLFADIMRRRYPDGDFIATRPWGKAGDQKNDGYLKSARTLFAVYAPVELRPIAKALRKVRDDFDGAVPYWTGYFATWTLVLNDLGVPPQLTKLLLEFDDAHPDLSITHMLRDDIARRALSLGPDDLRDLFGIAPSLEDLADVGYDDVQLVLDHIASQALPMPSSLAPVSAKKLKANGLSEAVETLLAHGMAASPVVERFFSEYHDATYADRIAYAFNDKYVELRSQGLMPDDIFTQLRTFAGGQLVHAPKRDIAVLVVLAYLFERCDIYMNPRGDPVRDSAN
jgi:hypothetical protein